MHRVLLWIGDFPVYSYGVLLSVAFVGGIALALVLGRRRGYPLEFLASTSLGMLMAGLLGARLLYVAQNLPFYAEHPGDLLNFRQGGISIQGGVVAGFAACAPFFRFRGIPFANGFDLYAAPALLGMAIGRVGCFLHGCCYGRPARVPWAVTFPPEVLPPVPRHPVQLYELGLDLALMAAVLVWLPRVRFAGQAFWLMVGGYGGIRFCTELFREGSLTGPLTPAQWLSLLFVAVGLAGWTGRLGRPPVVRRWPLPPDGA